MNIPSLLKQIDPPKAVGTYPTARGYHSVLAYLVAGWEIVHTADDCQAQAQYRFKDGGSAWARVRVDLLKKLCRMGQLKQVDYGGWRAYKLANGDGLAIEGLRSILLNPSSQEGLQMFSIIDQNRAVAYVPARDGVEALKIFRNRLTVEPYTHEQNQTQLHRPMVCAR